MTKQNSGERWWYDADRDPIHLAAADWFARLRDPNVSLDDTLAWQAWMQENPRHAEAFARIEEVSTSLRGLLKPELPDAREVGRDPYDASVPIHDWRPRPRTARRFAIAASIVIAGVALALVAMNRGSSSPASARGTVFTTAVGENRTVKLLDGSQVTLGGDSAIKVALSKKARRIELARGEAFFAVAKDSVRPFSVQAGDASVVALGTAFNVRKGEDHVVVAVVEGRVVVEPVAGLVPMALLREFRPKLAPVRLAAGEETTVGSEGVELAVHLRDIGAATAWQTGRLAFRLQPLRYVLEDVNRYSPKPIVIGDESIADLRVTGTVVGNNVSGWVASLESALGIEAVEEENRIVLKQGQHEAGSNH